ncbi:uncharacterized protein KD926_001764 [Aspergillus affinis]|uniref:uncharacterized protein n=1 Tax=Aspergillus affinis TaxID=1070780 RepID=UPI0022FE7252|nr:ubiquitin interaction motif protein [Aspergillus affinis]KAI9036483.1 ubiquitin interaction motif protein [Aspergillus affinis]
MTSEPTEESISNFVNFTSAPREQAVNFLKANDLNLHKAINAYFEDPTGPQIEAPIPQNDANAPYPNKGLSLAEQEERQLQQAVAMSLNQNLGNQESGVTSAKPANFGRATRDHYDEGAWAMTLFNSSAREIIISPDPADRKRVGDEPAFLRPTQDNLYLGGLLTILHSIPLAREALLLRSQVLSDYGHDPQWWNGQPISLPKIVTMQDVEEGNADWDDIIHETQRLVALLDTTNRSFGSADALESLKCMSTNGSEGSVSRFLETWQEAAVRADPGNQLATIFSSSAYKRPLSEYDTPIQKDFYTIDPFVDPEHGQTLYDVLDRTVWSDRPGESLDDVWLEHVAEVLTIKLESSDSSKHVDVKIPPVFYPDRYLASCRDIARDFRLQRLQVFDEIYKLERLAHRFSVSKSVAHRGMNYKEVLEKAAIAAPIAIPQTLANGTSETPEFAKPEAERLAEELRGISRKIEDKLKELESRKEEALATLRSYSKILTEPSASPGEPPNHRYTLRGVCTEPHVTYVLRRQDTGASEESETDSEWQWWRISFSIEDAKARRAESNAGGNATSNNADVVGYTARKVREIEVLKAAREESKTVLLVYAQDSALNVQNEPPPPPLQEFVKNDNKAFDTEFQEAGATEIMEGDQVPDSTAGPNPPDRMQTDDTSQAPVNVFDYQVSGFDRETGPGQEMQERGGRPLLSRSNTAGLAQPAPHAEAE